MVLVFLAPADEQTAVAVQPGVGGFDDPASCAPAGVRSLSAISSPRVRMCAVKPCSVASLCIEGAS